MSGQFVQRHGAAFARLGRYSAWLSLASLAAACAAQGIQDGEPGAGGQSHGASGSGGGGAPGASGMHSGGSGSGGAGHGGTLGGAGTAGAGHGGSFAGGGSSAGGSSAGHGGTAAGGSSAGGNGGHPAGGTNAGGSSAAGSSAGGTSAAGSSAGGSITGGGGSSGQGATGFVVSYKNNAATTPGAYIGFELHALNNGNSTVAVSDLKLRYYFTDEVKKTFQTTLNWSHIAVPGTDLGLSVSGAVSALAPTKSNADSYLEFSFSSAHSMLAPAESIDLSWQMNGPTTSSDKYDQSNDYSFDAGKTGPPAPWNHVVLLQGSNVIWGAAP